MKLKVWSVACVVGLLGVSFSPTGRAADSDLDKTVEAIKKLGGKAILNSPKAPQREITSVTFNNVSTLKDEDLAILKDLKELRVASFTNSPITGAGLAHLKGLPRIGGLGLSGTKLDDAGMEHVRALTSLSRLYMSSTAVTDKGLESVKDLTALEHLEIAGLAVTARGLDHLKSLSKLRVLDASGTTKMTGPALKVLPALTKLDQLTLQATTDDDLKQIAQLPTVTQLTLRQPVVTDAGLANLKGMTNLGALELRFSKVNGSGFKHLEELPRLTSLDLSASKAIDDKAVPHIVRLPKVNRLILISTSITDKGADGFKDMTQLNIVNFPPTVSQAKIAELKKALPKTGISGGEPPRASNPR